MQEKLPNVRRKKVWLILAVIVAIGFLVMWSFPGGDSAGSMAPPVTVPATGN